MNSVVDWSDHVPDREGVKSTINEVAFSPGKLIDVCYVYYLSV